LVDRYDLLGPGSGGKHGQDAGPTAHVEHHLQDGRRRRRRRRRYYILEGEKSLPD